MFKRSCSIDNFTVSERILMTVIIKYMSCPEYSEQEDNINYMYKNRINAKL